MGAGGGDEPPPVSSFLGCARLPASAIRPPKKERGVRRAGPRSDAYVSGRDTSLTPQKGLRPPAATSRDPLQPSVAALEDASTNLCNGGVCSLAAHRPEPGKDRLSLAPTDLSAAALAYATTARPAGTDHPDPSQPPTGPPNPDALRHLNLGRPAQAGLTRGTPRLPPNAPLPAKEPTRSERRAPEGVEVVPEALCSLSATADLLRDRCPPGPCGRRRRTAVLRTSRTSGSFAKEPQTDNNNRKVK
jgi:hypothetical protein